MTTFETAVVAAAPVLGPAGLRRLADHIHAGGGVGVVESAESAVAVVTGRVLDAAAAGPGDAGERAAFLRGAAAGAMAGVAAGPSRI